MALYIVSIVSFCLSHVVVLSMYLLTVSNALFMSSATVSVSPACLFLLKDIAMVLLMV